MEYIFLIGRILFGGFFVISGSNHFRNSVGLIQYAKSKGLPSPKFSVIFSGLVLIIGGAGLVLGAYTMISAILIGLFLLATALKMHAFWNVSDPQVRSGEKTSFMKNIALLGAALILMTIPAPWNLSVGNSGVMSTNKEASVNKDSDQGEQAENPSNSIVFNSDEKSTGALGDQPSFGVPSSASITVFNQKASDLVNVSLVSSDSSAWLAVREDKSGLMGNILGAKRIDIGTTANVQIPLQRTTEAGKIYHIVLFKDDGDRKFDFRVDPPMIENDSLISKSFLTL